MTERHRVWEQVPGHIDVGRTGSGFGRSLLAMVLAVAGPATRAALLPGSNANLAVNALVALVAASLLLDLIEQRHWPARLSVIGAGGLFLYFQQGLLIGLWSVTGLFVADWAIRRKATVPALRIPDRAAAAPVAVLMAVALYVGRVRAATYEPLVFVALAMVVTAGEAWGGPLHRLFHWVGDVMAKAVGLFVRTIAFSVLWIAAIAIPWLFNTILRLDPLNPQGAPDTWLTLQRDRSRPTAPWAPERFVDRTSMWLRVRRATPVVVFIVVVVLVARSSLVPSASESVHRSVASMASGFLDDNNPFKVDFDTPAAMKDAPWYQEMSQDMRWITDPRVAWNLLDQYRFADVETKYVNVHNGRRDTWSPPPGDGSRLTVWMYGGSTTFGIDQRDDHTIASNLAKVAHANGIDLDVQNFGVNGQTHFLEANRLAWDLAIEPAPDLVIFYDGVNELWAARLLNLDGFGDRREPLDPMTADAGREIRDRAGKKTPRPPNEGKVLTRPIPISDDPVFVGELAAKQYSRAREMSLNTARGADIPVFYFWQPIRLSRTPVPGEVVDPGSDDWNRTLADTARNKIPSGVIDLYDVLDDVDHPVFTDDSHHNEEAARMIAIAMFDAIRDDLEALL